LDVADRGGIENNEDLGDLLLVTREHVRNVTRDALEKVKALAPEIADLMLEEFSSHREPSPEPQVDMKAAKQTSDALERFYHAAHRRIVAAGWIPSSEGRASGYYRNPESGNSMTLHDALLVVVRKEGVPLDFSTQKRSMTPP